MYSQSPARAVASASNALQGQCDRPPEAGPLVCGAGLVAIRADVPLPTVARLQWLDAADRFLLDNLLAHPIEYVDDPVFGHADAEARLFGGTATLAEGSTYFDESEWVTVFSHTSRLTPDEERLAFRRYNFARMRVARIIAARAGRAPTRSALRLLLAWLHRALMIRGCIAQANIALAIAMGRRPSFRELDPSEVMSAAHFALLRSIDRFDCSRGFRFSTYACQGILQRILHVAESTRRYRTRFTTDFDEALDRDDSSDRRHEAQRQDRVDMLRACLDSNEARLTPTEREVIRLRFALGVEADETEPMTLQGLGTRMGVSKERVRQIEKRAIAKLRETMDRECVAV